MPRIPAVLLLLGGWLAYGSRHVDDVRAGYEEWFRQALLDGSLGSKLRAVRLRKGLLIRTRATNGGQKTDGGFAFSAPGHASKGCTYSKGRPARREGSQRTSRVELPQAFFAAVYRGSRSSTGAAWGIDLRSRERRGLGIANEKIAVVGVAGSARVRRPREGSSLAGR
jgi:hypothetical protein